jgi:hypothetical protein
MSCGWLLTDSRPLTQINKDSDRQSITSDIGLIWEEDDVVHDPRDLDQLEEEARAYEVGEYIPLFSRARNILDIMCGQRANWTAFKQ